MIIRRPHKTVPVKRKPSGSPEQIALYNTRQWKALSKAIRSEEPLCRECLKSGRLTVATVADHIEPARVTEKNFFDRDNLQPLCARCHNRKSQQEKKLYDK